MALPADVLGTLAQAAVTFAGFSVLMVALPQLTGRPWLPAMATGLWVMVALSLGAFVFSLLPLVLRELGLEDGRSISVASAGLALFLIATASLGFRRDYRLVRAGEAGPPIPPLVVAAVWTTLLALALWLNAFAVLPGSPTGWYLAALLLTFAQAGVPLAVFLYQLGDRS